MITLNKHILIVDDERDITAPLATYLHKHGYKTYKKQILYSLDLGNRGKKVKKV